MISGSLWEKTSEGAHRKGVASSLVNSQLFTKVGKGVEGVGIAEAFLVFSVASFNLTAMTGSIGSNQFVPSTQEA